MTDPGFDAAVFKAINSGLAASPLDPIMYAATGWGTGIAQFALSLGLITAGWAWRKQHLRQAGYAALIAAAMSSIVIALTKDFWVRPRPILALFDVRVVGGPLFVRSFPSGHSVTVWAASVAVCAFVPKLRLVLYPLAVLTAFSRVYVGAHYPLDVLFGSLLGAVTGAWAATFVPRNHAAKGPVESAEADGSADA